MAAPPGLQPGQRQQQAVGSQGLCPAGGKAGVIPPLSIRDRLLIGLLLDLGLRASEVAGLSVEDLAKPG